MHVQKWLEVNIKQNPLEKHKQRALENSLSVASRLASSPGPGARAWPGHGSRVGAWWGSPDRLFLGWVEVFGRAVRPGLALFTFWSWSGRWRGAGGGVWGCFMVRSVVVTGKSFVPIGIIITVTIITEYSAMFIWLLKYKRTEMSLLVIFMASASSVSAVGSRAVERTRKQNCWVTVQFEWITLYPYSMACLYTSSIWLPLYYINCFLQKLPRSDIVQSFCVQTCKHHARSQAVHAPHNYRKLHLRYMSQADHN